MEVFSIYDQPSYRMGFGHDSSESSLGTRAIIQ